MVNATVDNTPVTVLLSNNETYTPATGSIQKVTVAVPAKEQLEVSQAGSSGALVGTFTGSGEPNVESVEMVIDETVTLEDAGSSGGNGIYISGFEVA